MESTIRWAEEEFGDVELGDARRSKRLRNMAAEVANQPAGTLTQALKSPAEREGAYRFVENEAVEPREISEAAGRACARRCRGAERVVVALDQTTLSLVDRQGTKGFGRVGCRRGPTRGFEVMNAVAVTPDGCTQGVLAQHWYVRPEERSPSEDQDERPTEERESVLWHQAVETSLRQLQRWASGTRAWFQFDRGADINHLLEKLVVSDADFTVRSAHNRRLETGGYLHEQMRSEPVLGRFRAVVRQGDGGGARPVRLALRAGRVVLRLQTIKARPYGQLALHCVHVCEEGSPGRQGPIEWFLLTNVEVTTAEQAAQVVSAYQKRWRVEDFHRAWKSGVCDVESSQLRSALAIQRWATLLASVAARAERLKTQSRAEPDSDALELLSRDELDAAIVLSRTKKFAVGDSLTLHQAVDLIATAGGYTGKSSGGPPGATTIGRGLQRVQAAAEVFAVTRPKSG